MTEKKHAKYSASASERWMKCPGSIQLSKDLPPTPDNKWSVQGTLAHECLEEYLTGIATHAATRILEQNPKYDPEMIDHALDAYLTIDKWWAPTFADSVLSEMKVRLPVDYPGQFGTLDAAIVDPFGELWVIDYKYGTSPVYPKDNSQLIYYALGLADLYNYNFATVKLAIIQPRGGAKRGRVHEMKMNDLLDWKDKFQNAIEMCESPDAKLSKGDHCYWCPAKASCPLHDKTEDARNAFAGIDETPLEDFLM